MRDLLCGNEQTGVPQLGDMVQFAEIDVADIAPAARAVYETLVPAKIGRNHNRPVAASIRAMGCVQNMLGLTNECILTALREDTLEMEVQRDSERLLTIRTLSKELHIAEHQTFKGEFHAEEINTRQKGGGTTGMCTLQPTHAWNAHPCTAPLCAGSASTL